MLNCDWSVDATGVLSCLSLAHISDVDQMTAQTGSTEVGPIRLSNRSDNCRALVKSTKDGCRPRAHTARFYVSTPDERLKSHSVSRALCGTSRTISHGEKAYKILPPMSREIIM